MIKNTLFLALLASQSVWATQMGDFIQKHYDTGGSELEVKRDLTPLVIVGDYLVFMENQNLEDIHQITKAAIREGEQYKWLCINNKDGISYAFISDSEMGQGDLTSIAVLKHGEGCDLFNGEVNVSIKNIPLLSATSEQLEKIFGKISEGYYQETPVGGDYTQASTLQYFPSEGGVIISQITAN